MRSPVFFRSKVERLERAGDLRAIIAVLSGHTDKMYERAHAAKALADCADRLGPIREQAVAVLTIAAEEPSEVRKWALFALAEISYMTYHLDITTFLFAHTISEVLDVVAFVLVFVGFSQRALRPAGT